MTGAVGRLDEAYARAARPVRLRVTVPFATARRFEAIADELGLRRCDAAAEAIFMWTVSREDVLDVRRRAQLYRELRRSPRNP